MIAGIDLSLTSPAICVFTGDESFSIDQCHLFYLTDNNKKIIESDIFHGSLFKPFDTQYQRYENISVWIIDILNDFGINKVYLEDYSYGSTGRIFHIAENTGILKYLIWKNRIETITLPPTVIKKTATGKGNANKELMQAAFIQETGLNLKNMLSLSDKQWNPSSDLIDSYFICKHGYFEYEKDHSQV